MKLQKRVTVNTSCLFGMNKKLKRKAFRQIAKEALGIESKELSLKAARNWGR